MDHWQLEIERDAWAQHGREACATGRSKPLNFEAVSRSLFASRKPCYLGPLGRLAAVWEMLRHCKL